MAQHSRCGWKVILVEKAGHLRMISLQVTSQWHIRTPSVYRMLPEAYVDEFFATGRLRLSSFRQFAKHRDEERGDLQEGKHILVGRGVKQTVFAVTAHGHDAYILCGSQVMNRELQAHFSSDSAVFITDTTAFGIAVARQFAGFRFGMEGPCVYQDGSIQCDIGDFELEQLRANAQDSTLDLSKLGGFILNMAGAEVFFRKRQRYQHQSEYRWVWLVDHEASDHIFIDCPDARQFCRKIQKES